MADLGSLVGWRVPGTGPLEAPSDLTLRLQAAWTCAVIPRRIWKVVRQRGLLMRRNGHVCTHGQDATSLCCRARREPGLSEAGSPRKRGRGWASCELLAMRSSWWLLVHLVASCGSRQRASPAVGMKKTPTPWDLGGKPRPPVTSRQPRPLVHIDGKVSESRGAASCTSLTQNSQVSSACKCDTCAQPSDRNRHSHP